MAKLMTTPSFYIISPGGAVTPLGPLKPMKEWFDKNGKLS